MAVGAKSKKSWEQLAHTLDEIAPGGQPNPPSEMITSIVEAVYDDYAKANFTNYELRREDLNQLAAFARQFKDVHEFLSQLALISNIDAEPALDQTADNEAVNLSSVHQAKGLEYHTVFVIWLTDGMFPSTRSLETRDAIEEERRLFYVAITRARDELYLTLSAHAFECGLWRHVPAALAFPERNSDAAGRGLAGAAQVIDDSERSRSEVEESLMRQRELIRFVISLDIRVAFVHSINRDFRMNLSPDQKIAGVLAPLFALRTEERSGHRRSGGVAAVYRLGGWDRVQDRPAPADQRNGGRS